MQQKCNADYNSSWNTDTYKCNNHMGKAFCVKFISTLSIQHFNYVMQEKLYFTKENCELS